jgi:antitoxin VapB
MALNIKSDEAHRLARELAEATGTSLTEAVTTALRRTLSAETRPIGPDLLLREIEELQVFVSDLADRDPRTSEEILGYDAIGLPG